MTASGTLDLSGCSDLQYELSAELANLQPLPGMQALAGALQVHGQASGDRPALTTRGTLEARAVRYQDNRMQA
jgi:autotransporter translocation and assembly factor TamB